MKINLFKISPIIVLKKYNCIKCHSIKKKSKIPNLIRISYKYKNNKIYKKYLFKKIKWGSKNIWGNLIMPKNNIENYFIKFLVKWILNIKYI